MCLGFIIYCLHENFNCLGVFVEKIYHSLYNVIRSESLIDGALAQLGECLHGMQEVVGSSPTCSIRNALGVVITTFSAIFMRSFTPFLIEYINEIHSAGNRSGGCLAAVHYRMNILKKD